ncbi:MAG: TMEM175 family protein [Candidatus Geothermincolia bacterium]
MKDKKLTRNSEDRDQVDESGISLGRIMSFSDGVFAVAITLLVLSIKVPVVRTSVADQELPHKLLGLLPIFEAYIISFLVIGLFWIGHHRVFRILKRHDNGLLWLNLLFLMFIVFIPFPTALMSEYSDARVALIFYAVSLAAAGLILCFLLWYGVHNHRLVDQDMDPVYYRRFMFGYIDMAVIFLLSIAISYLNVHVARLFWLFILPSNLYFDHVLVERLEKKRAAKEGAST